MPLQADQGVIKLITYVAMVRDGQVLLVEYATPPNPKRIGWWIPAPEAEFGEDPRDRASRVVDGLGLLGEVELTGVESFTAGGAWHVIFHYRAEVSGEVQPHANIRRHGWFAADELPDAGSFAHGKWERDLALRALGPAVSAA